MPRYILLHETASTNTYLSRMAQILPSGTVIYTNNQSAGRGQRGNSWEAEPGKNLTFSMLIKDIAVPPNEQFYISEAVSLAISSYLKEFTDEIKIKWPNDIYYKDKKICGILIEHTLLGNAIKDTIIGAGLNINQTQFLSDAPNPISLAQIIGKETPLEEALHTVCERIEHYTDFHNFDKGKFANMHKDYLSSLYRNDGLKHRFAKPNGEMFEAYISDVLPDGTLCLADDNKHTSQYSFKEIAFVI